MEKFKDVKDPYIDNQVNMEEYEFLKDMGIQSLLIYPLRNEKELLGLLIIGKDVRDYFLDNMTFFERVSTQFSIALSNARIYSKMEDLAMKDGLTGIYNRAYMTQKINEHISGSVLSNSAWAILIFDIDYFKKVNDRYGHLFGDEVIRVCANQAKETAELYHGVAARYGGEEFVIIVKGQSIESLREIANDLHSKIKQKKVDYRGDSVYVDVSVGVAAYPFTCNNPAELIDRADKAMYYSKQQGRGCITFDGEYVAI
jgi:diguanylate cyclase (GGDEF)-like protein